MKNKNKDKNRFSEESIRTERRFMIGPKLSFAAAESYKLLRTNLMFSFANTDINGGKVIGITSSVPSEGKSITMLNLAYTFAESKKKVILIEGDMRLPTLASRLKLKPTPGLSNLMVESNSVNGAIQKFTTIKDGTTRILM